MPDNNTTNTTPSVLDLDNVYRHQIADYLNIGTSASPEYVLMGYGFTSLNEEPGAQTENVKYVNMKSTASAVTHYETRFPFEAEHIPSEDAIDDLYEIARNHCVGKDAVREYVRVELWNATETTNVYEARKFYVSCEITNYEGENKQVLSGNLNAVGDPVLGTFNVSTKTFTEASA